MPAGLSLGEEPVRPVDVAQPPMADDRLGGAGPELVDARHPAAVKGLARQQEQAAFRTQLAENAALSDLELYQQSEAGVSCVQQIPAEQQAAAAKTVFTAWRGRQVAGRLRRRGGRCRGRGGQQPGPTTAEPLMC
jgi:hypothetical protein